MLAGFVRYHWLIHPRFPASVPYASGVLTCVESNPPSSSPETPPVTMTCPVGSSVAIALYRRMGNWTLSPPSLTRSVGRASVASQHGPVPPQVDVTSSRFL